MPVVGTTGHVDHGKSTLVQRLTGRDPDRWAEEKRRGLTIDLGFAWATLPGGVEVSFVDVPGHERFLKNMLAGVEPIDVAILVVAADEGWMPQTEEHLAILDLLEVRIGMVALTKIDLVDGELLEIAEEEIRRRLAGTSLEMAEIVPVSSLDGRGIPELTARLGALVAELPGSGGDRPRMWVDRSFSAPGAGTIVTGTLLGGSLATGDEIEVYPWDSQGRIRALQSHERVSDLVSPASRVAVNLAGIERSQVSRGDMLGYPGQWETSSRFSAAIRVARYVDEVTPKSSLHLHIGSGAHPVRLVGIDGSVGVLETTGALPLASGDRFILRDTGRRLVIAGGRIVDPAPGRLRSALQRSIEIDPSAGPDDIATGLLRLRGTEDARVLGNHSQGGSPRDAVRVDGVWVTTKGIEDLAKRALDLVLEEHDLHPLREGLSLATLAKRLGVEARIAETAVAAVEDLQRAGAMVTHRDHLPTIGPADQMRWEEARERMGLSLAVPRLGDLGLGEELIHLLIRSGDLVRVSAELVFLPEQIATVRATIAVMPPQFTVAEFRDRTGLSRKYAVPLLEWADEEGLTIRWGGTRTAR